MHIYLTFILPSESLFKNNNPNFFLRLKLKFVLMTAYIRYFFSNYNYLKESKYAIFKKCLIIDFFY